MKQLLIVGEARRDRAFLREAQILANLEHRALPDIIDYFTIDAGHFLVMDFIPGDDLAQQLTQRRAPFPLDTVMRLADQVLDVLTYLHTQWPEPIYHGDIKPHNLKLRHNGEIILLDFGLAKGHLAEMSRGVGDSSIVGYTPGFSPPEQIEGARIDARSDLYALGATLHCLLTNSPPVDEASRWRAVARGREDPLRPVHELNPAVPVAVGKVLIQAVALERDERPASAAAMRAAMQAACDTIGQRSLPTPANVLPLWVYEEESTVLDAPPRVAAGTDTHPDQAAPTLFTVAAPPVETELVDGDVPPHTPPITEAVAGASLWAAVTEYAATEAVGHQPYVSGRTARKPTTAPESQPTDLRSRQVVTTPAAIAPAEGDVHTELSAPTDKQVADAGITVPTPLAAAPLASDEQVVAVANGGLAAQPLDAFAALLEAELLVAGTAPHLAQEGQQRCD